MSKLPLALTALMLAGCGSSGEPSSAVTGLSLVVHSAEWEAERNLVVVGEDASAEIATLTEEGCLVQVPCSISADVEVRSSNPDVLSPLRERVRAPATVALVAHAPGTATVTVTTNGLTQSKRIDVVSAPLPLDAIRVALVTAWNDLPAQYDASGTLTSVELPRGQYAALEVVALRSGMEVFGVPIHVSPYASNPPVTEATVNCRPTRVDINCEVFSDVWIYGMAPGDDQITVWGRGTCAPTDPEPCPFPSASFTAHVTENP